MIEGVCPSCGACAADGAGKCVYCGTQRQPLASVSVSSAMGRRSTLKTDSDSPDFQKKQILKEISFLENQYKETSHPSILAKIENAQNKLRILT